MFTEVYMYVSVNYFASKQSQSQELGNICSSFFVLPVIPFTYTCEDHNAASPNGSIAAELCAKYNVFKLKKNCILSKWK